MTQSLADKIAALPDSTDNVSGSVSALPTTPELPNSDMINVAPHLLSRIEVHNAITEPVTTGNVEENTTPIVTEEQLLANLKQELLDKGASPALVECMTIDDFEIVGKTRKNKMVSKWDAKRKADMLIKGQANVSPVEQPKTVSKKVKTTMSKYDEQIKQHDKDIKDLTTGMNKIISLLSANQTASVPTTPVIDIAAEDHIIPKIAKQAARAPVTSTTVIPKIEKTTSTPPGATVAPEVFYPFMIKQMKKHNKPYGKESKVSKGVHAVYGGLNKAVKDYYGEDTDVVALTNKMAEEGVIAMKMVRGGPMVFHEPFSWQRLLR